VLIKLAVIALAVGAIPVALNVNGLAERIPWRGLDGDPVRDKGVVTFNRAVAGLFGVTVLIAAVVEALR
jgi:uncharacterized membrane protein